MLTGRHDFGKCDRTAFLVVFVFHETILSGKRKQQDEADGRQELHTNVEDLQMMLKQEIHQLLYNFISFFFIFVLYCFQFLFFRISIFISVFLTRCIH